MKRGIAMFSFVVFLFVIITMVAFVIDIGLLLLAKNQLQNSADAAAMAGTWELWSGGDQPAVNAVVAYYAGRNLVLGDAPEVVSVTLDTVNTSVYVLLHKTAVSFVFGPILGVDSVTTNAAARATFSRNIVGFGEGGDVMPFAIERGMWEGLTPGVPFNLYPGSDDMPPGNFGTVNIGDPNNSTDALRRQIEEGLSAGDLEPHGGELTLDGGSIDLTGDPGISGGIESALEAIIDGTRVILIYDTAVGSGGNTVYTITQFVGVRILEIDLSGQDKRLIVEVAPIVDRDAIVGPPGGSEGVATPVHLTL